DGIRDATVTGVQTCALPILKNLVGIIHPRYRPSVSFLSPDWHVRIAELNLAVHPHLTIADGTTLMIAGGPTSGTPAQADILLLRSEERRVGKECRDAGARQE